MAFRGSPEDSSGGLWTLLGRNRSSYIGGEFYKLQISQGTQVTGKASLGDYHVAGR